jgi:hypothetical protein
VLLQDEAARIIGVGPSKLAKWGRGERESTRAILARVQRFPPDGSIGRAARGRRK